MPNDYELQQQADLSKLEGKTIYVAEFTEDEYVGLRFTDGTTCILQGTGYDGLWDQVSIRWAGEGPR